MQELEEAPLVVIVAAHPDDETIGAGALLPYLQNVHIVHVTDGAPRSPADAIHAGFDSPDAYAEARRRELEQALGFANVSPQQTTQLHFTDQDTMHHMPELIESLAGIVKRLQPALILTHPYEGGHPDHDTIAFAVAHSGSRAIEMTSYHFVNGVFETGQFLPNGLPASTRALTPEDRTRKERMLACFTTQQRVLSRFPVVPEQFRPAPHYDFTQPPHPGPLHYESLPWNIAGAQWRALAAQCL